MTALLEKLPIGAAAGASGWTYTVMKAIFLLRNQWGLHTATGPASLFCNLADALREAALSSLAPHKIRFVPRRMATHVRSASIGNNNYWWLPGTQVTASSDALPSCSKVRGGSRWLHRTISPSCNSSASVSRMEQRSAVGRPS